MNELRGKSLCACINHQYSPVSHLKCRKRWYIVGRQKPRKAPKILKRGYLHDGKGGFGLKLKNRLTLQLALLVLVTCLIMGMTGYVVARRELGIKGETILKNGVRMALDIIEANQQRVLDGAATTEEAQERVKVTLLGPRNPDGTRDLHGHVDLGENGYFIVYDVNGVELMHPRLEGMNMWNAVDPKDKHFFLVQDQIAKARNGGGFTWYNWDLPNTQGNWQEADLFGV